MAINLRKTPPGAINLKKRDVPKRKSPKNSFIKSIAREANDFVCSVYNKFPDRVVTANDLTPNFVYQILDELCELEKPPTEFPPACKTSYHVFGIFVEKRSGSKCNKTGYWRTMRSIPEDELTTLRPLVYTDDGLGLWKLPSLTGEVLIRPLSKSLYDSRDISNSNFSYEFRHLSSNQECRSGGTAFTWADEFEPTDLLVASVPADFCRDIQRFPESNPPPVYIENKNVISIGGITNYDFSIELNANGTFNFPLEINVGSLIEINVDANGFNISNGAPENDALPFSPPSGSPGSDAGGAGSGGSGGTAGPRGDRVSRDGGPPSGATEEVEEEEVLLDNLTWVVVTVTRFPDGGRHILMENEDNSTFFAGYFCWTIDYEGEVYRLPEQPIRKKRNAFQSPGGVNGYVVYAVNKSGFTVERFVKTTEQQTTEQQTTEQQAGEEVAT